MSRLAFIIVAFGIILQSFSKILIYAGYETNREYIAKVLCIQKDKPVNKCNGSCHLKKQLQKADQQEQQLPAKGQKEGVDLQLFAFARALFDLSNYEVKQHVYPVFSAPDIISVSFSITHPPEVFFG